MVESSDSTITLTVNKTDAYLLRRYVTELEYRSASYDLALNKITLLERKELVWEQTVDNYRNQLVVAENTLHNQIELQNRINDQIKEDIEQSRKNGIKRGAIMGSAATLVVCLLLVTL